MPFTEADNSVHFVVPVVGDAALELLVHLGARVGLAENAVRAERVVPFSLGDVRGWQTVFHFSAGPSKIPPDAVLVALGPGGESVAGNFPSLAGRIVWFVDERRVPSDRPLEGMRCSGNLATGAGVMEAAKLVMRVALEKARPTTEPEAITIQCFDSASRLGDPSALPTTVRLATSGLAKRGTPELELVGIPATMAEAATGLLHLVATKLAQGKADIENGVLFVALGSGVLAPCLLAPMPSHGHQVVRVLDPATRDPEGPAFHAITAFAADAVSEMDDDDAIEKLTQCRAWFPGERLPTLTFRHAAFANENGSHVYLALAQRDVDPERNLEEAWARSSLLAWFALGRAMPPDVSEAILTADVAAIVEARTTQSLVSAGGGVVFLESPILTKESETLLSARLAMGPASYRAYFSDEPMRSRLCSPEIATLAARIYARWRSAPIGAVLLAREALYDVYEHPLGIAEEERRSLEEHERGGPKDPLAEARAPRRAPIRTATPMIDHLPLLSRILASLGRELAAGASVRAIEARWGLVDDAALVAAWDFKLAALRRREAEAIMKAYATAS